MTEQTPIPVVHWEEGKRREPPTVWLPPEIPVRAGNNVIQLPDFGISERHIYPSGREETVYSPPTEEEAAERMFIFLKSITDQGGQNIRFVDVDVLDKEKDKLYSSGDFLRPQGIVRRPAKKATLVIFEKR